MNAYLQTFRLSNDREVFVIVISFLRQASFLQTLSTEGNYVKCLLTSCHRQRWPATFKLLLFTTTEWQSRWKRTRWRRVTWALSLALHWWSHGRQTQRCPCPPWWITLTRPWWWSYWCDTSKRSLTYHLSLATTSPPLARGPPNSPLRRRCSGSADTPPPWWTSKRWGWIQGVGNAVLILYLTECEYEYECS